jgi:competence protein ComEC
VTPTHVVRVAILDVGQADTIVVTLPDTHEAVIVDCFNADAVIDYLRACDVQYIRGMVITHLHLDHYKGAVQFLIGCEEELQIQCETLLYNSVSGAKETPKSWLLHDADNHSAGPEGMKTWRARQTAYNIFKDWTYANYQRCSALTRRVGSPLFEGNFSQVIEILSPYHGRIDTLQAWGLNNASSILKIHGPGSSALLTGDIEVRGWEVLQEQGDNLRCDVLKFPHHGAWKGGDAEALLNTVAPSYVAISVGKEGVKYDHPNPHVLAAIYGRRNIHLRCTGPTGACHRAALGAWSSSQASSAVANAANLAATQPVQSTSASTSTSSACSCGGQGGNIILELADKATLL